MAMKKFSTLQNCLLVAMPSMDDPQFIQAVVYIYEHNEHGAMGITINKPMNLTLDDLLEQLNLPTIQDGHVENNPILLGGPVAQKHGFVIHLDLKTNIKLTTSKEVLKAIGEGKGPEQAIVSLGYAGWEAGELEQEIIDNYWILAPADPKILFNIPFKDRWKAAASLVGVDFTFLAREMGHA